MKKKKNRSNDGQNCKLWAYEDANAAVPYIRPMLKQLREDYIKVWHLFRKDGHRHDGPHADQLESLQEAGGVIFKEMAKMGVLLYENPRRGIALFPFLVHYEDGHGSTPREASYVYMDTRNTIDSYIFHDEFQAFQDLYAWLRPVPAEWKKSGIRPTLHPKDFA